MLAVLAGKLEARRAACAPLAGKSTLEHTPAGEPGRYHRIGHDGAVFSPKREQSFSLSIDSRI